MTFFFDLYGLSRSGNVYEGAWENDLRHGKGLMKWVSLREEYNGDWIGGLQQGYGEHIWHQKRIVGSQYPLSNRLVSLYCTITLLANSTFRY